MTLPQGVTLRAAFVTEHGQRFYVDVAGRGWVGSIHQIYSVANGRWFGSRPDNIAVNEAGYLSIDRAVKATIKAWPPPLGAEETE